MKILSRDSIQHYSLHDHTEINSHTFLPLKEKTSILITSGASCPDAEVEKVIHRLLSFYPKALTFEQIQKEFLQDQDSTLSNAQS
jgi:4-hydroxy-3-methylbut-2-enyl diphosphate reductase